MKSRVLSFGSLASPLARNQTQAIVDALQAASPRLTCQLNFLATPVANEDKAGEPFQAASRAEVDFLERMVIEEESRLIVMQAADMVLPLPTGLEVLCVPDRGNPFDSFLNRHGRIMDEMENGSIIGVLSTRARSQLSALWPNLTFEILRGGVDRAMEAHLRRAEIDGLVLPSAVTEHLGVQGIAAEIFSPEFVLPGPGQGLLAVVGGSQDLEARELLACLHSEASAIELLTEQAFCSRMISDQDLPVGALARVRGGEVVITGTTGKGSKRISVNGPISQAEAVGVGLATQILGCAETFADLLEADFPEGLPDEDEDPAGGDGQLKNFDLGHGRDPEDDDFDFEDDDDLDDPDLEVDLLVEMESDLDDDFAEDDDPDDR